jgi:hypothetical protein
MFRTLLQPGNRSAPSKLILSGRYDLREREYLTTADPEPIEIGPFTDDEALDYLKRVRHVREELLQPVIRKAGGNPFVLSLIADLIDDGDICTVADVANLEPHYLIRRVIDRIPTRNAVRWGRYGVVPAASHDF